MYQKRSTTREQHADEITVVYGCSSREQRADRGAGSNSQDAAIIRIAVSVSGGWSAWSTLRAVEALQQ